MGRAERRRPAAAHAHQVGVLAALGRGDFEDAYLHAAAISPPGVLAPYFPLALWVVIDLVEAAVRTGRLAEAVAHASAIRDARIAALSPRLALLATGAEAIAARDGLAPGSSRQRSPSQTQATSLRPGPGTALLRRAAAARPGDEGIAATSGCCP